MKAQEIYYGLKIIRDEVNGKIERVIVITRTNLGKKVFIHDISQMSYIDAKRKAEEIQNQEYARYLARRMAQAIK